MPEFLKKLLVELTSKLLSNQYLLKIKDYLKTIINSIRVPSLLSFSISKEGQINPKIEDTLAAAPDHKTNWERMGFDKEAFSGMPRWTLFTLIVLVVSLLMWSDLVKQAGYVVYSAAVLTASPTVVFWLTKVYEIFCFAVDFLARFGVVVPLGILFYSLTKPFRKK